MAGKKRYKDTGRTQMRGGKRQREAGEKARVGTEEVKADAF